MTKILLIVLGLLAALLIVAGLMHRPEYPAPVTQVESEPVFEQPAITHEPYDINHNINVFGEGPAVLLVKTKETNITVSPDAERWIVNDWAPDVTPAEIAAISPSVVTGPSDEPALLSNSSEESIELIDHIGQIRDLSRLKTIPKDKIIVVRNDQCDAHIKTAIEQKSKNRAALSDHNNDHIQDVLDKLGIPYTLIGKSEFEKKSSPLDGKWAVLFNCNDLGRHCCNPDHGKLVARFPDGAYKESGPHTMHSSELSEQAIEKIRFFAEQGGYLFTEDLQIVELMERVFGKTIVLSKFLEGRDVPISPGPVAHPYLKYVFDFQAGARENSAINWKIDYESPNIKVLNKDKVTVLVMSPKLVNKYDSEGAMAVTFAISDPSEPNAQAGQALHVMTHFGKQTSKAGEFALQNLLVNFLEDCVWRHTEPKPAKEEKK